MGRAPRATLSIPGISLSMMGWRAASSGSLAASGYDRLKIATKWLRGTLMLAPTTGIPPAGVLTHSLVTDGNTWFLTLFSIVLLVVPSPPPPDVPMSSARFAPAFDPVFGTVPGSAGTRLLLVLSSVRSVDSIGLSNVLDLSYSCRSSWLDEVLGSTVTITITPGWKRRRIFSTFSV